MGKSTARIMLGAVILCDVALTAVARHDDDEINRLSEQCELANVQAACGERDACVWVEDVCKINWCMTAASQAVCLERDGCTWTEDIASCDHQSNVKIATTVDDTPPEPAAKVVQHMRPVPKAVRSNVDVALSPIMPDTPQVLSAAPAVQTSTPVRRAPSKPRPAPAINNLMTQGNAVDVENVVRAVESTPQQTLTAAASEPDEPAVVGLL